MLTTESLTSFPLNSTQTIRSIPEMLRYVAKTSMILHRVQINMVHKMK